MAAGLEGGQRSQEIPSQDKGFPSPPNAEAQPKQVTMLRYPRSCRWGNGWVMLHSLTMPMSGSTRHISAPRHTAVVLWFCFSLGLQSPKS